MDVFSGEPPTQWRGPTEPAGPLTDEQACVVALLAARVNVFTNQSLRASLDALPTQEAA